LQDNEVLIEVEFDVTSEMTVTPLMEYKKEGFWSSICDIAL
jgi:hypothetical protein